MQRMISSMMACVFLREEALRIYFFLFGEEANSNSNGAGKQRDTNGGRTKRGRREARR